jgi:hypothetical protein
MPLFLSEGRPKTEQVMPLRVSGGVVLSTKTIGFMMAVQGIYSMISQLWLFPFIVRTMGALAASDWS